ncbi:MAG: ribose 5-phosphate isomerase A [Candidatus Bathyarchaeota archaeon]
MNPRKDSIEEAKLNAALESIKHVKDEFVIGLGSGSTISYVIKEIGTLVKKEEIHVIAVPTSYQTFRLAIQHGIPITTLAEHTTLNLAIDGADQIDQKINLIKGMGGALTQEKIVAEAAEKLIIVADERKKVKFLGENNHPVPIEVMSFALSLVTKKLEKLGGKPMLRMSKGKVGPVVTDNGNFILDVDFGIIQNPLEKETKLKSIPGVIETGLFIEMADLVYLGEKNGVKELKRED